MNIVTFWPKRLDVHGDGQTFITVHVHGRTRKPYGYTPGEDGLYLGQQLFTLKSIMFEHVFYLASSTENTWALLELEVLDIGSILDTMKACALMAGAILAQAAVELTDEPVDIEMVAPQRRLPEPKKELTGWKRNSCA